MCVCKSSKKRTWFIDCLEHGSTLTECLTSNNAEIWDYDKIPWSESLLCSNANCFTEITQAVNCVQQLLTDKMMHTREVLHERTGYSPSRHCQYLMSYDAFVCNTDWFTRQSLYNHVSSVPQVLNCIKVLPVFIVLLNNTAFHFMGSSIVLDLHLTFWQRFKYKVHCLNDTALIHHTVI